MKIRYSVTFEFENRPPLTHRGEVEARQPQTCAFRAIREAKRVLRPSRWSSMVYVALDRADTELPGHSGEAPEPALDQEAEEEGE